MRFGRRTAAWLLPLGVLAVGIVWWPSLDWHGLKARGLSLDPTWWVAGAAGLLGSHLMRALRLHAEWAARCGVGVAECLRVSLLHSAAVNLLPMRSGELGFPLLLRRRWGVPLMASGACLVWMRVQDALMLGWSGAVVAAAIAWSRDLLRAELAWALGVLATSLLALCAAAPRHLPRWQVRGASSLTDVLDRATPVTWVWCGLNWLLKLGTLGLLMALLLGERGLVGWCAAWAGEAAAVLPVQAPAGFGTYEAAAAMGARLAGATSLQQALPAALAVHVFTIGLTLAGALVACLAGPARRVRARPASEPV